MVKCMYEELIPSFLITFREALEAALIVTLMVTYLRKMGNEKLVRYAYLGAGVAVLLSVILGGVVQTFYGGLDKVASEIFEGVASISAVAVLTYMIIWMSEHAKDIRGELESKLDTVISKGEVIGIVSLTFVAVLREGLETVLFLSTSLIQDAVGTLLGVVLGGSLVFFLSILLMRGTVNLRMDKFFKVTSVLLLIFGAGLAGYSVHELIEAGENMGNDFGILSEKPFDINPPLNLDGTYPLLHENGIIGSILKALVGYDGNPEWLRIMVYLGYWSVIGSYLINKYRTKE